MRVSVDAVACQGHGRCYGLAPDVFEPDDHGHCVIPDPEVTPEREVAARTGVENCPEDAISLESDDASHPAHHHVP